jgi:uncharacterized membrane protein YfcA
MSVLAGFADISILQLVVIAFVALFASFVGGVAGYGPGALMPLVLVPLVGAAPTVPIMALSSMFSNSGRVIAFRQLVSWRRVALAFVAALPGCILGAWGYTLLTGRGAAIVIGTMLILSVPLRRLLKRHGTRFGDAGFAAGSAGYGFLIGGTAGSGVVMISLLLATGLQGAAVIATDALISITITVVKLGVFIYAGVMTPKVIAVALLMGAVMLPGPFLAKAFVERLPVHVHTAILDAVVIVGGSVLVFNALR